MNYYYEFTKEISVFGQSDCRYYVLQHDAANVKEAAERYAVRIWAEGNGQVQLVKNWNPLTYDSPGSLDYNEAEFLVVKLRARNLI
jgi:hypothetical protein